MLRVQHLRSPLIDIPLLEIGAGECVAVMGASGAGKSLLLRCIADLDPHQGEVSVGGRARSGMPAPVWRRTVMLVPAESGWWADRVDEHFLAGPPDAALLEALGLPPAAAGWTVARLSTGERHRLAIARALGFAPEALLLDEPSSALDGAATARLEAVLRQRLDDGACLLLVTHDPAQAERLADRTLIIENGHIPSAAAPGVSKTA